MTEDSGQCCTDGLTGYRIVDRIRELEAERDRLEYVYRVEVCKLRGALRKWASYRNDVRSQYSDTYDRHPLHKQYSIIVTKAELEAAAKAVEGREDE